METITGFIAKIATKSGTNQNGKWTAYSAKIQLKDGSEHPKWMQFGFEQPKASKSGRPLQEGDYVQFKAEDKNAKAMSVDTNTVRVSKNPPAKPQSQSGQSRGGQGGGGKNAYWEEKDRYYKEEEVPRITYSAARTAALQAVQVMSDNDGLPIPKAQGKANVEKRYNLILELIEKLTVQFYHDSLTLRVLDRVSDAGDVDTGGDGDLPDSDEFDDDGDADAQTDAFGDDDDFDDDDPF